MKTTQNLLIFLLLLVSTGSYAQQKGSFEASTFFMNETRPLSCYVPLNYDSTQQYHLMICLHGAGDNSVNLRNALVNSLNWPGIFSNTIFICPDGGSDRARDFYAPAGDEGMIDSSISYAVQHYNIDTSEIILHGFSLGGRSALKYGLDHPAKFKALLLNTPALQGMFDIDNVPGASLGFDYPKASLVPMYITVGAADQTYAPLVNMLVGRLKKNDGILDFTEVAGLGHTIPGGAVTNNALAFMAHPVKADYDLDVFQLGAKDRYCSDIQATCLVRNTGAAMVTSIKLNIQYGSISTSHTWTGSLAAYQHAAISLPAIAAANGTGVLKVTLAEINTSHADPNAANDTISHTIEVVRETTVSRIEENFEGNISSWINQEDSYRSWYIDSNRTGNYIGCGSSPFYFNTANATSYILSPAFNLSAAAEPTLSFDLAFNYLKYTSPYFVRDTAFADTLEILVTADCGQSFRRIYKKGGAELATAAGPIVNGLRQEDVDFLPKPNEWRKEIIDLKPYTGAANVYLKFNYISGNGGNMYMDNVRIAEGLPTGTDDRTALPVFSMYPNPAGNTVNLTIPDPHPARITIYDNMGKTALWQNDVSGGQVSIDLNELSNGFYVIEVAGPSGKATKKLLISK